MLENGFIPQKDYFSYYELENLFIPENLVNNNKSSKMNFYLVVGGFVFGRVLILKILLGLHKKQAKKTFLILASIIYHIFKYCLNIYCNNSQKKPRENEFVFMIKDGILNKTGPTIPTKKMYQTDFIYGLIDFVEFRNFLNEKRLLYFKSLFDGFFEKIRNYYEKFKNMLFQLEKFDLIKEKMKTIDILRIYFPEKYREYNQKYTFYKNAFYN